MDSFLQGAIHPERYHGPRRDLIAARRSPFFEGWYYKLIDAAEQHRYAIIPGVSLGRNAETRLPGEI